MKEENEIKQKEIKQKETKETKQKEIKLEDEGFEEITPIISGRTGNSTGTMGSGSSGSPGTGNLNNLNNSGSQELTENANRPDLRIVQADRDRDGKSIYVNVGGMWKNVSKNGNEFYTIKVGNLKLLAFPNERK